MSRVVIVLSVLVVFIASGSWYFFPVLRDLDSWKAVTSHPTVASVKEVFINAFASLTKKYPPEGSGQCLPSGEKLFTPDTLKAFDGNQGTKEVYLAFLGVVYDVSRGSKHYGPGGTYSMFAGRDASRAFVTGDFNTEGLLDDVTDLETASFSGIRDWAAFYDKEYVRVGRVTGTYFDSNGCPTQAITVIESKYKQLEKDEAEKKDFDSLYPPCNSEWSQETQTTRFWCTNLSGGVKRDWVGYPRKLFIPSSRTSRCTCYKTSERLEPGIVYDVEDPLIEGYEGCDPHSHECSVKDTHN